MPRVPARVQNGLYGSQNPANGYNPATGTGYGRAQRAPLIMQPGPVTPIAQTADRQVNDLQQNARTSAQPAKAVPFSDGNLLESVSLNSGDNIISHGLGKPFRNAWLIGPSAHVTYTVSQGTSPSRTCVVNVSGPCVADLWVYG